MDPTNSIVWTRKSFIGSVLLCVMQGWFSSKLRLGSKISDGSQLSARFFAATNSHRDITNRNQPLLFFHMDPTNSIVWTRKSFIGSLVLCRVGFHQNFDLGQKSVMDPSCQHNFLAATNSHRDITNRNEPLLFIHMDPTNSILWTRKSFIGSLVSCRVGFQQNFYLGQKVSDGSQLSAQFPCSHQQPQGHNKQESTTFILPYGSNKQHCMDKEGFHWLFGVMQDWFLSKLGSKNQ
jgi:hypothetical protein